MHIFLWWIGFFSRLEQIKANLKKNEQDKKELLASKAKLADEFKKICKSK